MVEHRVHRRAGIADEADGSLPFGGAAGLDRMGADLVRALGPFTREGQVEPGECPRTLGRGEVRKGPPCDVIEAVPADRPEPQVQRPSIPAGGRWGRVRARRLRTDESEG